MKKIITIVSVGLIVVVISGLMMSREKVLPPLSEEVSQQSQQCPNPFIFTIPVDINRVTSILYPGQVRGGNFKAHGGFRFDGSRPDEITVYAPYDAQIVAGARYPANGEIQYTFDFAHPCGVRYRFGHLLTLAPKFQNIAESFPLPTTLDSRTTQVNPPVNVKQGEVIATAVGLTKGGPEVFGGLNTFVDWGVYDHRQQNKASQDPNWATAHISEDSSWAKYYNSETYLYAVCWFDWISSEDRNKILALPSADGEHGEKSDFCK